MTLRIISIVGARPQFIKAAVVSQALRETNMVEEITIHTGQHYDENMSAVFFEELEIPIPKYNLNIGSGTHGAQTGQMLEAIENILFEEKPDWVLVFGDTNSTLAGALAAAKLHIPVAHVEAGLRSFNREMPEEINRVLTDHISDLLFVPTDAALLNLRDEGIFEEKIQLVGDVMYDAVLYYSEKAEERSKILDQIGIQEKSYILGTIHRAENTDNPERLRAIFNSFSQISNNTPIVLPLHPRTKAALQVGGIEPLSSGQLHIIGPVGYLDMMMLEKNAQLIVTDSGGMQKEAFFHRVPCITLRDETEWVELVELGWNHLIPPINEADIVQGIQEILIAGKMTLPQRKLYGGGKAANLVAKLLLE